MSTWCKIGILQTIEIGDSDSVLVRLLLGVGANNSIVGSVAESQASWDSQGNAHQRKGKKGDDANRGKAKRCVVPARMRSRKKSRA